MIGIISERGDANRKTVIMAFKYHNSIIIDSARACDPYKLLDCIDIDMLDRVYVISIESVYRFRSAIRLLPSWIKKLEIKRIFVTFPVGFYSYNNRLEDNKVLEDSYRMLIQIEKRYGTSVFASLPNQEPHHSIVRRYCLMAES
ncbi:MAG: hypothetical protein ACMXYL_01740 [Candidatus Woesearchaeota archaeon]